MSVYRNAIYTEDNIVSSEPIAINNVGYIGIDHFDAYTNRPYGRKDYQLIYIKSGVGYFKNGDIETKVNSGHVIFYKPDMPQIYTYFKEDKTEVFWIHFSGTLVEKILSDIKFNDIYIVPFSNGNIFIETTNVIFDEMRRRDDCWNIKCCSQLISLMVEIKRNTIEPIAIKSNIEAVRRVCSAIEENYFSDTSNKEYAKSCDMSVSNFLRIFKELMGTTPQQYKIFHRIKAAENMLTSSSYSISQISQIIGFSDRLYFSRVFKKVDGISPSEYRTQHLKENQTTK